MKIFQMDIFGNECFVGETQEKKKTSRERLVKAEECKKKCDCCGNKSETLIPRTRKGSVCNQCYFKLLDK